MGNTYRNLPLAQLRTIYQYQSLIDYTVALNCLQDYCTNCALCCLTSPYKSIKSNVLLQEILDAEFCRSGHRHTSSHGHYSFTDIADLWFLHFKGASQWGDQENKYSVEVPFTGAASPSAAQLCSGQNCKQPAGQTMGQTFEMASRTWVSSVPRTFGGHAQHEILTNPEVWGSDLLSQRISTTGAPSNFSYSISVMSCCSCCIYFSEFHPIYKKIHCLLTLRGILFCFFSILPKNTCTDCSYSATFF